MRGAFIAFKRPVSVVKRLKAFESDMNPLPIISDVYTVLGEEQHARAPGRSWERSTGGTELMLGVEAG